MIRGMSSSMYTLADLMAQGIEVPEVLRKYIPGQPDFLPYVKELPKDSTSLKQKGQAATKEPATKIPPTKEMKDLKV